VLTTTMIVEAVRVAQLESRSAMPESPMVAEEIESRRAGRFVALRRVTSSTLHRIADALEPAREIPAPAGPGAPYSCS
jgi:hypothetical protein